MDEIGKLLDKLAIEAAASVLAEKRNIPGSQELVNLEAAREILGEQYSIQEQSSGLTVR